MFWSLSLLKSPSEGGGEAARTFAQYPDIGQHTNSQLQLQSEQASGDHRQRLNEHCPQVDNQSIL